MATVPYKYNFKGRCIYMYSHSFFLRMLLLFAIHFVFSSSPGPFLSPATDAPPAYDQVFGISDLKEAKRESSNHATFAVKFCEVVSGTSTYIGGLVFIATPPSLEL